MTKAVCTVLNKVPCGSVFYTEERYWLMSDNGWIVDVENGCGRSVNDFDVWSVKKNKMGEVYVYLDAEVITDE